MLTGAELSSIIVTGTANVAAAYCTQYNPRDVAVQIPDLRGIRRFSDTGNTHLLFIILMIDKKQKKAEYSGMDENIQKKNKPLVNIIIIAVLLLIIFLVFHKDYKTLIASLRQITVLQLIFLLLLETAYFLLDWLTIYGVFKKSFPQMRYRDAVVTGFLEMFGMVGTASAGTLPLQCYYLYHRDITPGSATGLLIFKYSIHKAAMMVDAFIFMMISRRWLAGFLGSGMKYLYAGFAVCTFYIAVLLLICMNLQVKRLVIKLVLKLPDKKIFSKKQVWADNIESMYQESHAFSRDLKRLLLLILLNCVKICFWGLIPYCALHMLHGPQVSLVHVFTMTFLMLVVSGALPNVAGMGSVETAFVFMFAPVTGRTMSKAVMLLYRIATYFTPFLASLFVMGSLKKKNKNIQKTPAA